MSPARNAPDSNAFQVSNFASHTRGGWSPISAALSTVGNGMRVHDSSARDGNPLLLCQFVANVIMNGICCPVVGLAMMSSRSLQRRYSSVMPCPLLWPGQRLEMMHRPPFLTRWKCHVRSRQRRPLFALMAIACDRNEETEKCRRVDLSPKAQEKRITGQLIGCAAA